MAKFIELEYCKYSEELKEFYLPRKEIINIDSIESISSEKEENWICFPQKDMHIIVFLNSEDIYAISDEEYQRLRNELLPKKYEYKTDVVFNADKNCKKNVRKTFTRIIEINSIGQSIQSNNGLSQHLDEVHLDDLIFLKRIDKK
ncbi:MAG: hypothetical protein LBM96_06015 [Methanobrevibacter sp.]|jgi:hypothetical protein|nr:hypothetical protein [Candidatus Methanoflexus mossambicus]